MRNTIVTLVMFVGACLMGGCASGDKYPAGAAKLTVPAAGQGRIFFYRDGLPMGMAVQPDISLNGQNVGKSVPNGFFYVDRPAGSYEVRTATEAEHKLNFALASGEEKYVRTTISMGLVVGQVTPSLQSREDALKILEGTSYLGPKSP